MKAATTAFTFKTLLRHYAKRALTPRSLNVKLGPQRGVNTRLAQCLNSVLNMKAVVAAFNLLRDYEPSDGTFEALLEIVNIYLSTSGHHQGR